MEKLQPKMRFPEFEENWQSRKFSEFYSFKSTNSLSRENLNYKSGSVKNIHYGDIHTKFKSQFDISKEKVPYVNPQLDLTKVSNDNYIKEGDLVIADASEDYNDIGKSIEIIRLNNEKVLAGLHTFLARKESKDIYTGFPTFLLKTKKVRLGIMKIAQGTKVLSLSSSRLGNIFLDLPTLPEQTKIASFLTTVDEKISGLKKQLNLLERYKKGVMQKIFSQKLRFKDENGNDFPDWEEKKLGDCLDYEQPTPYLVNSTEYDDSFQTPVLTAGKTFILGYTNEEFGIYQNHPIIIFDDFTTASQFVNFSFKAKSSAMKILKVKGLNDIKFLYEAMQMITYETGGHGRHWISVFAQLDILIPTLPEQQKIASFLSSIDEKIEKCQGQLRAMEIWKKGLLQQMFV